MSTNEPSKAEVDFVLPNYIVWARFGEGLYPREKGMHEEAYCGDMDEALAELAKIKKHGGYAEAQIVRHDVQFKNGLSRGCIGTEVVKRWRARKQKGDQEQ